jgi:hypothetical protein
LTRSRREILLSAAFAIWGLAVAVSLAAVWTQPAPPGQLPGLATKLNFDAHGPFRWMAGMIVLPILFPLLLRPVTRRLLDAQPWAFRTALIAPLAALWFVLISRDWLWTIIPFALVILVCTLLRSRELAFTRYDVVLVAALLALLLGLADATDLSIDRVFLVAALLVFALRVAVALIPSPLPPALAFVLAPLGLVLQTSFFARDQRYFGWHAVLLAVVTPFLLRFFLRNARRAVAILVIVTYPLSLAAYINATSLQTAEGKPRVNVFEDSHSLLPASEYLAGELPYRDIIPTHGLIEDGLLDFLIMKTRGVSVGTTWKTRLALGVLNVVALYALAYALTGSAGAAFLAVLLASLTNMFTPAIRLLPSIVALALLCGAVRLRRLQWLRYAAIATVIAGATSIDFGAYTFLTLVVAVLRYPGDRLQAFRAAAMGTLIAVVPLFGGFAVLGILDDFFRTTFIELLSLGPVYTQTMFEPPAALPRNFPEALAGFFHRDAFLYLIWCVAVIVAAILIARARRRRFEPLLLVAVFMVVTAISYAERHHLYFHIVAAPFTVALAWMAMRRRSAYAPAIVVALLILAAPTTHLGVAGWIRDVRGPVEPTLVEVPEIPRARGAFFHEHDAAALRGVARYASLSLAPEETWLDFTNRGIFYFLLRRDCPIRQPEVAFYETEQKQREVIARLEGDPRIRAVLLPGPDWRYNVDGVFNHERAPLVWQYIQTHFAPDFAEGNVVMWRRK